MRLIASGHPIELRSGDTVLSAMARAGRLPAGCLCAEGDCPNCLAVVDGVAYTRMCQTPARPGMQVEPFPVTGPPELPITGRRAEIPSRVEHVDAVVIGAGTSGTAAAARLRHEGRSVAVLEARAGDEALAVYRGPEVVARLASPPGAVVRYHAGEVVVATGAAAIHPVCPGSRLTGIMTPAAASALASAGVDLGAVVAVNADPDGVECRRVDGTLIRFEGTRRVEQVVVEVDGVETPHPCDTAVVGLGSYPRNLLARMADGAGVSVTGRAAGEGDLPPYPEEGIVCPCAGVTIADLESVHERGFHELELIKRATLAGTGTCQGSVCTPYLRSFAAARGGEAQPAFTARPMGRQMTVAEAAAGRFLAPFRRTALDAVHRAGGARMDRFGGWWRPWRYRDTREEYWAVREAVSLGDVSTLGKMTVRGPDAAAFLEQLYPCRISTLVPGRSRYALLLDESGAVLDDGMVSRLDDHTFTLTFTTGGASHAEAWVRDWAETLDADVRILDRTDALGAINVTGPLAGDLLALAGLTEPPPFMSHVIAEVAGVRCHVHRLSFTGELSYELHHAAGESVRLWETLMDLGAGLGARPHGLDALLTLRLEKGHVIVGVDTEPDSTPRRLGMEWAARLDKPFFVGRHALERTGRNPLDKQLVGLTMEGAAPIEGAVIHAGDVIAGYVTSARYSPALGHSVMLGWLHFHDGEPPAGELLVDGLPVGRTALPFYDPEGSRARA